MSLDVTLQDAVNGHRVVSGYFLLDVENAHVRRDLQVPTEAQTISDITSPICDAVIKLLITYLLCIASRQVNQKLTVLLRAVEGRQFQMTAAVTAKKLL